MVSVSTTALVRLDGHAPVASVHQQALPYDVNRAFAPQLRPPADRLLCLDIVHKTRGEPAFFLPLCENLAPRLQTDIQNLRKLAETESVIGVNGHGKVETAGRSFHVLELAHACNTESRVLSSSGAVPRSRCPAY